MASARRGISLLEITVALAIALIVVGGVAKILSTANKSGKSATARADFNSLFDATTAALRDPATCHTALLNGRSPATVAYFSPTATITATDQVAEIRMGTATIAKQGATTGNLNITDLSLTEADPARRLVTATEMKTLAKFTVKGELTGGGFERSYERSFYLTVSTTLVTGALQHQLTHCELQTAAPLVGGGYTVLARHSQSTLIPACPTGWDSLWTGYSFAGGAAFEYSGNVDLGTSGSCLENWIPLPFMTCDAWDNSCDWGNHAETPMWLAGESVDGPSLNGYGVNVIRVSRCRVCAKPTAVLVRHNLVAAGGAPSAPACPTGWTAIWTGYSFGGTTINASKTGPTIAYLNSPGSCLEQFRSNPVLECHNGYWDAEKCDYWSPGDASVWMSNFNQSGPLDLLDQTGTNLTDKIGRCSVCAKD